MSSAKIRKALSLAIDRSKICDEILPFQIPSSRIIPKSLSLIDLPERNYEKDLKTAKKLFEEGLKEIKYKPTTFLLTLSFSNRTNFQEALAYFLQDLWESTFGIKILLKEINWDVHWNNLFNGEFEIGGSCRFPLYLDAYYFLESFLPIPTNYSRWKNQSFLKWFYLSQKSTSLQEQKECLKKAEEILQDNLPAIPVFNRTHLYLCNPNLQNVIPPILAYTDFKWACFKK